MFYAVNTEPAHRSRFGVAFGEFVIYRVHDLFLYQPMPSHRFPPRWTIDDNGSCFIVKDDEGHALAYAYTKMSLDAGLPRIL